MPADAQELTKEQRAVIADIERRGRLELSVPATMLLVRNMLPLDRSGRPLTVMGPAPAQTLKALGDRIGESRSEAASAGTYWDGVRDRAFGVSSGSSAMGMWSPTAGMISGTIASVAGRIAEDKTREVGDRHYANLKRFIEGYAHDLVQKDRERIFEALGPRSSESLRTDALKEIGGGLDKVFKDLNPRSLKKDEIVAATPAMLGLLREGIVNGRLLQKQDAVILSGRIAAVERVTEANQKVLTRLALQAKKTEASVQDLEVVVPELKNSLQVTNSFLLSRMSAGEQLLAVRSGMDIGLTPEKKKELVAKLEPRAMEERRVGAIRSTQQTANDVLTVASTSINLARVVGIDVPPEADRAVAVAQGLFNVAAGFALNPMAGISALNGTLGILAGPKPPASDPKVLQALTQIREDLKDIKALQRQTLEKLDALDEKMSARHLQIMESLERISAQTGALVAFAHENATNALEQCRRFESSVNSLGERQYDRLVAFFNTNPRLQGEFNACSEALNRFTALANQRPNPLLTHAIDGDGNVETTRHLIFLQPALDLMAIAYKERSHWCDDHVRLLTTMPPSMAGHDRVLASCRDPKKARNKLSLTLDGPLEDYQQSLGRLIHHDVSYIDAGRGHTPLIELIRRYQSVIGPMYELIRPTAAGPVLLTAEELRERGAVHTSVEAEHRAARLLDLIALAAAQESMMAGVGQYEFLWDAIEQSVAPAAGGSAVGKEALSPGARMEKCDLNKAGLPKPDARSLVCLFERHPQMLANAVVWRLRRALVATDAEALPDATRLSLYGMGVTHAARDFLGHATAAGPQPLAWPIDADGVYGLVFRNSAPEGSVPGPGAYFKYRAANGSNTYMPVPREDEVKVGLIKYRPSAYPLMETRQQLMDEYLFYLVARQSRNGPGLSAQQRSVIAIHALQAGF